MSPRCDHSHVAIWRIAQRHQLLEMKALTSLRSSLQVINPNTDNGRVPNEIRRCLELVQTCHRDLQHLIDLRNEHLELLDAAPSRILTRVNNVIDAANQSLVEARRIVEKSRPKAHQGMKTSLQSHIGWVMSSSSDFRRQEPIIIRHNAAVLAELSYLRQITMWTLLDNGGAREDLVTPSSGSQGALRTSSSQLFRTLEGHASKSSVSTTICAISKASSPESNFSTPMNSVEYSDLPEPVFVPNLVEYSDLPEPIFPNAAPEMASSTDTLPPAFRPSSFTYVTTGRENSSCYSAVLSPSDDRGLSLLFGE